MSDTQKKFQRVDFDLTNLRNEMKDLSTKNLTFRNDILGAIREIKDICRTNTAAINKLSDDVKVIRDDLTFKIDAGNKNIEINIKEIGDLGTDLNNFKSIAEKEIFETKSECGYLNKSVKKIIHENEQSIINQRQNQERQQDFFSKKLDSFLEKIEQIHSGMERKIDTLERDIVGRRDQDDNTRKML